MNCFRHFSKQGFSLVETLVIVGIMGIVLLGVSSVFTNLYKENQRMNIKQDALTAKMELRSIISANNTCKSSLVANQRFNLAKARQDIPTIAQAKANRGMPLSLNLSAQDTISPNVDLKSYNLTTNFLNFSNAEHVADDSAGNKLYKGRLWASFNPKADNFKFPIRPSLVGGLFVKVTPSNRVMDCFSLNDKPERSLEEFAEEICKMLGGKYVKASSGGGSGRRIFGGGSDSGRGTASNKKTCQFGSGGGGRGGGGNGSNCQKVVTTVTGCGIGGDKACTTTICN